MFYALSIYKQYINCTQFSNFENFAKNTFAFLFG
jgi:hypothetical protein